jgi:dTDP-D-glucose 4,6-dehydratase
MRTVESPKIRFDPSKPDGTPRKLLDSGRLFATGWRPKATLEDGLRSVYAWYWRRTRPAIDLTQTMTPRRLCRAASLFRVSLPNER